MPAPPFFSFDLFDLNRPLFTLEDIRQVNPQRYEMEQLTAVVWIDREQHGIVGYKDVTPHEFWVRGHMPSFPLMPGVIMCEVAAQLAGFYARKFQLLGEGSFAGIGGLNDIRLRQPVRPGDRLVMMARITSLRPGRRAECEFQGYVDRKLACEGRIIAVPIHTDRMPAQSSAATSSSE
ncbi:MAG: beta-hydroxyacyl-ACP dehydratase [Planctomycetaceae bacterium]|nr:MAG: beta-hydroxyacyl-ACP dehydratase [Planctomycetaceae bacterium]